MWINELSVKSDIKRSTWQFIYSQHKKHHLLKKKRHSSRWSITTVDYYTALLIVNTNQQRKFRLMRLPKVFSGLDAWRSLVSTMIGLLPRIPGFITQVVIYMLLVYTFYQWCKSWCLKTNDQRYFKNKVAGESAVHITLSLKKHTQRSNKVQKLFFVPFLPQERCSHH